MLADSTPPAAPTRAAPVAAAARGGLVRLWGLLLAAACGAAVVVAFWLEPRAGGAGTHEQLGLPYCSFLVRTGYPCPTCGMTTSVSAAVHGRLALAWRAHPFGVVFAAGAEVGVLMGLAQLLWGRRVLRLSSRGLFRALVAAGAGLAAGWAWNVVSGLYSGQLPLR